MAVPACPSIELARANRREILRRAQNDERETRHWRAKRRIPGRNSFRLRAYFLKNSMSRVIVMSSPIIPAYLVMPKSERLMAVVAEAPRR